MHWRWVLGACVVLSACGPDYGVGLECAPGAALACTCEGGEAGWMICDARGFPGACECVTGPGIVVPDAGFSDAEGLPFELIVTPERIDFGLLGPGEERAEGIEIANAGPGPARISVSLEEGDPAAPDPLREFSWGDRQDRTGVVLEAGAVLALSVVYAPQDTIPDRGVVWVHDHAGGARAVELDATAAAPDIEGPQSVDLGEVPTGGSGSRSIFLRNAGGAPLRIDDVALEGPGEFSFCLGAPGEREPTWCPPRDQVPWPLVLAPGQVIQVRVGYRPAEDGPDAATLVVRSDDPDEPRFEVGLSANGASPCVAVDVEAVDFGEVPIGRSATRPVIVTNCSALRPLLVAAVRVSGDVAFSARDLPPPLPAAGLRLEAGQSMTVQVRFAPLLERGHRGALSILSNDPGRSPSIVELSGRGVPFDNCPVAAGGARAIGGGDLRTLLDARPLDTIAFDAAGSFDPDDPDNPEGISRHEWTIVERPADSNAALTPSGEVPDPQLFLDLAGRYVVELRVFDAGGQASCEALRVTILTVSDEDIHVQLVWETPGDPDELDVFGTDMDLHLLHPNGGWGQSPWDCHWTNINPDWGTRSSADDPSLDIDDTNGAGPENINLDNPEPVAYTVGAHYYGDNGFGQSFATVRIFLGGTLIFEALDKALDNGQFWEVARIDWAIVDVLNVDAVYDDIPLAP